MKLSVDVVVDLAYGDCGKGKVTHSLLKSGEYTHCIRYNGGHNAGHTIIHEGQKVVTHVIPAGVMFGVKSIIGPGCVVSPALLSEEIIDLLNAGINPAETLKIDKRTHVITEAHLDEDGKDAKIGTTKRGNGPAYRDKYGREGIRAEDSRLPKALITDIYEELHGSTEPVTVLMEGAQGFGLDIDWGDYPYVTSSHCTTAGAMLNGIPPKAIRNVYGVIKAYETYVGTKDFQGDDPIFERMQEVGKEYGATTNRKRKCNYLDVDLLQKAISINGVTHLVINKMDVLKEIVHWGIRYSDGTVKRFATEKSFKDFILELAENYGIDRKNVYFSYGPEDI